MYPIRRLTDFRVFGLSRQWASLGQVRDTLYKFSFPNGSDFCRCRVDAAVSLASVDEGVNVPFLNKGVLEGRNVSVLTSEHLMVAPQVRTSG